MKRFLTTVFLFALLGALFARPSFAAGWVPQPVTLTLPITNSALAVATTGTVTAVAAPAYGTSYFLNSVAVGPILPVPTGSHTAATTGTVTTIAAPPATQSYLLSAITVGAILPASVTNKLTLAIDSLSYAFSNATLSAISTQTVTSASVITATLTAGVTNRPTLTFTRTWSPDTQTVAVVIISGDGATTNTYTLSIAAASTNVPTGYWVESNATITVTRSASVTNLPALTFYRLPSPATYTRTLLPHEHWRLWGARPASTILPAGTTLGVAYTYGLGGTATTANSFVSGAVPTVLTSYVWLSPGDTITLTSAQVTNSPSVKIMAERYYLQEPLDVPPDNL
jgi:hypothetical protein